MAYVGNVPAAAYTNTVKDTFSGNGSTVAFTLSRPSLTNDVRVVVENVIQDPTVAYSVSGTTLTFTSAPPSGTNNIYVVHLGPAVMTTVPPSEISAATTFASNVTVQGAFTSRGIDDNADAVAMTIDSSENVLVGKTSTTFGSVGVRLSSTDNHFTTNGGAVADFNRLTSDGSIVNFYKDGTTVGSIGVRSGTNLNISGASTHAGLEFSTSAYVPFKNGSTVNGQIDLGSSFNAYRDLYLSGGVYLGGTGAANLLDDYEEGTFTPVVRGRTTAGTGTYTRQSGYYTKVGRTVTLHMDIGWSAHTGSGGMEITLPFATGSGYQAGGFMSYNSGMTYGTAAGDILSIWMDSSSTNMRVFYYSRTGSSAPVNVPSSASEIHLQVIYNT